jgi:hypothetical protein
VRAFIGRRIQHGYRLGLIRRRRRRLIVVMLIVATAVRLLAFCRDLKHSH